MCAFASAPILKQIAFIACTYLVVVMFVLLSTSANTSSNLRRQQSNSKDEGEGLFCTRQDKHGLIIISQFVKENKDSLKIVARFFKHTRYMVGGFLTTSTQFIAVVR